MPNRRILIIDDDPNVTRLLAAKLTAVGGIDVEATNEAEEATALAQRFRPNLIVCDIDLGETCGGDIAHDLAGHGSTATMPIVFLSSMITPEDMQRRTNGPRMISKQLPMPEIIRTIVNELPKG